MASRIFFNNFVKNNGFTYNDSLSDEKNLQLLINHLHLRGKGLETLKRKFLESKRSFPLVEEKNDYEIVNRDLENVSKIRNIKRFFSYFKEKYPRLPTFNNDEISSDYHTLFKSLSSDLKWKNVWSLKYNYLWSLEGEVYLDYLESNLRIHGIRFNSRDHYDAKFDKLADKLLWKNYIIRFQMKFNELVGIEAEYLSKNLEDLQNIIRRYNILPEENIPFKINECKRIIKDRLFVNIYDFISDNDKQFDTLEELIEYTKEEKKFFDRKKAKKKFIYKVLLKHLL